MKKMMRRVTAMVLAATMAVSTLGIMTVSAANGSEWQIATDDSGYAYYTVEENTGTTNAGLTSVGDSYNSASDTDSNAMVEVYKTIEGTTTENQFNVELQVVTSQDMSDLEVSEDAAVVIVMDVSGSMLYELGSTSTTQLSNSATNTRIAAAKTAANTFVDSFATTANAERYISVVTFGGSKDSDDTAVVTNTVQGWTDIAGNGSSVQSKINNISIDASSRTNIVAGLEVADDLLDSNTIKDIDNVYVILLSDGLPNEPEYVCEAESMRLTVDAADTLKEKTALGATPTLYTISYGNNSYTTLNSYNGNTFTTTYDGASSVNLNYWLRDDISSGGSDTHFTADTAGDLTSSFAAIYEAIRSQAEAWQVIDPMGQYINLVEMDASDLKTNDASTDENGTITWDLIDSTGVANTKDGTTTFTLNYTIQLDTDADSFKENTYYLTNGETTLEYFFRTVNSNGEVLSVTDNAIIDFKVPAVMGQYPDYTYIVRHMIQTGTDQNDAKVYEIGKEESVKTVQKYDVIENEMVNFNMEDGRYTDGRTRAVNRVASNLIEGTDEMNPVTILTNGQYLDFYYDLLPTTATVNHYYYSVTKTNDGDVTTLDDTKTQYENLVYIDDDFTATANPGQGYSQEKGEDASVTIKLMADGAENVVDFYYYKDQADDNRSDVKVEIIHEYTTYNYVIEDGRYVYDDGAVTTSTEGTTTYKYGESAIATLKENGFDYVGIKTTSGDLDKDTLTVSNLTADLTTITLSYELYNENPNDLVDVTVNHIYETEKTFVDADGEIKTVTVTDGKEVEIFEGEYYVGETFKAEEMETFEGNDYESYAVSPNMSIKVTAEGTNEITIKYTRDLDMLVETDVTVIHTYTLKEQKVDEEGVVYYETTVSDPQEVPQEGTFYVGQDFTATAVNTFDGRAYGLTTESAYMTITLAKEDNVVELEYYLEEKLDDAEVTVTHTYTTKVTTYENGAWVTKVESVESGDNVRYKGVDGESYAAEEIFEFEGETYTRTDSNDLSIRLDEKLEQSIDLTYERTYTQLTPTTVTVNHYFTTSTKTVDGEGNVVTETDTEYVPGTAMDTDDAGNLLYAGMSFTATEIPDLDGREGFTAAGSNVVTMTLEDAENVINLYYTKSDSDLVDASVVVLHAYTTYTTTLVNGTPSTSINIETVEETEVTGKYVGQFFTATAVPNGFTQITEDDLLTITLEAGRNVITIAYEISNDYTEAATLDVTHVYTTEYATGKDADVITEYDAQIGSWATVTHGFSPDTFEDLYEVTDIDSDNKSVDEDAYTIVLEAGSNEITIEYYRFVDDRTPLTLTVGHFYGTYDEYTQEHTDDGSTMATYVVYLEDGTYTAELVEEHLENIYDYQGSKADRTIELTDDYELYIGLEYLRTIDTTPETTPGGGGGKPNTGTVIYPDEDDEDDEDDDVVVDIPEEDVPLVETPVESDPTPEVETPVAPEAQVEIPEEEVPLVEIPVEEVPLVEIPVEEVPLGDAPQTGDSRNLPFLVCTAMASAAGLSILLKKELEEKKKRSET